MAKFAQTCFCQCGSIALGKQRVQVTSEIGHFFRKYLRALTKPREIVIFSFDSQRQRSGYTLALDIFVWIC